MLFLNILPQDLKKEIKYSKMYETIKKMVICIVVLGIISIVIIIYSKFILEDNLKIRQISGNAFRISDDSTQKISKIVNRADKILKVQADFHNYSNIIYDIMQKSGSGISFNNISIDTKLNKISMSGLAGTRDDLLNFKNIISNSDNYSNINFPIENLLTKENLKFDISIDIKSYEY